MKMCLFSALAVIAAVILLPLLHLLLAAAIVAGAAIFVLAVAKALFWPNKRAEIATRRSAMVRSAQPVESTSGAPLQPLT